MSTQRKSIRVYPHERQVLVEMYVRWCIPIDQFENRPADRAAFLEEWITRTSRRDSFEELLHYMRTQRKRSLWVKLGESCVPVMPTIELSAEETETLVSVYANNVTVKCAGSDNLGYDSDLLNQLANEFASATGRIIPAHDLNAKLTALRKRGLLTRVADVSFDQPGEDMGFEDIDKAAS